MTPENQPMQNSEELENPSRRAFLKGAAAIVGGGLVGMTAAPEEAEAAERIQVNNAQYVGFENAPQEYGPVLESVKEGLELGLRFAERDFAKNGTPISCSNMPLEIYFRKTRKGFEIDTITTLRGQRLRFEPIFRVGSLNLNEKRKVDPLEFAKHIKDRLLESPDEARQICSGK